MVRSDRTGIAVAGSVLVDKINEIRAYPQCGELTQIVRLSKAVGGCVPNVALDLKKICPTLDVYAIGKIGGDEEGTYVSQTLQTGGVDISGLVTAADEKTSFTDVMSVINGQRTFFTYPGASAVFGFHDVDFDALNVKTLHLGYFLLLEKVDRGDGLAILQKATELGIRTSIDLVSENSDRYGLVLPCLPYTDYLIVNEVEAGKLADMEPTDGNLKRIAYRLRELGVREKVVIHKPEYAVCCSADGYTVVNSYRLPDGYIKGTTGAGDAFCAGTLIGIYNGWQDREILEFASACAVMALGTADATGDPGRKLAPNDRLIGAATLAQEKGIVPTYMTVGAAAGVHRYIKEAEMPQSTASARAVLQDVACLSPDDPITALILDYYEMICSGSTVAQLCEKAEQRKHAGLGDVV